MNNPNPFVPQGSLLERQSRSRSRFKWGVLVALTVSVIGLSAMLFQGCKREEENPPESDNNPPPMQTNDVTSTDTNVSPNEMSNAPAGTPGAPVANTAPMPAPAPVVPAAPAPPTESEYVVVRGDTLGKIAKSNGVTLRALESANPDVKPTQLHVGEKLVIPAGASTTGANAAGETANGLAANGDEIYVVKAGDSLTRIAHHFGVTVKAIEAENNLTTARINVGKKLQIPAKAAAEPAPVNAPPQSTTAPEPVPAASNPPAPAAPAPSGQQ